MIPQDDPLLKLLKEINTTHDFTVIDLNPFKDREIEALHIFGLIEITQVIGDPYQHIVKLTDSGRDWLDAATRVSGTETLTRHYEKISPPDDDLLLRPYQ